jgi:hypothetical protein
MISQISSDAGLNGEALNLATAMNRAAQAAENGADAAQTPPNEAGAAPVTVSAPALAKMPVPEAAVIRAPVPKTPADRTPVSKMQREADAQKLEAHASRRQRLAEQFRAESPARTDEEIEELLEQFGA